jgi:hypothetical protein
MTVSDKMHQALTTAEGLKAQLEMFGHDTSDKFAKSEFYRMAQVIEEQVIPGLRGRTNQIEQQEPQYNIKQQAQQQAQQQS